MTQVGMAVVLLASLCSAQDSSDFQPTTTNVWGAQHPCVDGTGRVEIRIKAPDATSVRVNFWSGVVTFTATASGRLLGGRKMPPGDPPLTAADCYRFALSHPGVDVCMMGARTADQVREDLRALDLGPLGADEMARARRIGDHIYGKPRARPGEGQAESSR